MTQWTIHNCTWINCSSQVQIDSIVQTTFSELYIRARTLPQGIYEFKLTMFMTTSPMFNASSSAFVRITPSGITANLVQYGTSMITRGYEQDFTLDPGTFSLDPDGDIFNATVSSARFFYCWQVSFCRIGNINITVESTVILYFLTSTAHFCPLIILRWIQWILHVSPIEQVRLEIILSANDTTTLLKDNQAAFKFNNLIESSVTIINQTLLPYRTYQFMVHMENRRNSSLQATGYLLVNVDDTYSQIILVA